MSHRSNTPSHCRAIRAVTAGGLSHRGANRAVLNGRLPHSRGNRAAITGRRPHHRAGSALLTALLLAGWIVIFTCIYRGMSASSTAAQRESLEQALDHAVTTCYALEGMYPPDLEYMKEHYGLIYDEDLFYVDYQPVAANIRPSYYIIEVAS